MTVWRRAGLRLATGRRREEWACGTGAVTDCDRLSRRLDYRIWVILVLMTVIGNFLPHHKRAALVFETITLLLSSLTFITMSNVFVSVVLSLIFCHFCTNLVP